MTLMNEFSNTEGGQCNDVNAMRESVEVWLVALDRLKSTKPIPRVLYEAIKDYITI